LGSKIVQGVQRLSDSNCLTNKLKEAKKESTAVPLKKLAYPIRARVGIHKTSYANS